jgi:hypothetical protein
VNVGRRLHARHVQVLVVLVMAAKKLTVFVSEEAIFVSVEARNVVVRVRVGVGITTSIAVLLRVLLLLLLLILLLVLILILFILFILFGLTSIVASSNVASSNVASSNVASSNVASSNVASSNVASSTLIIVVIFILLTAALLWLGHAVWAHVHDSVQALKRYSLAVLLGIFDADFLNRRLLLIKAAGIIRVTAGVRQDAALASQVA